MNWKQCNGLAWVIAMAWCASAAAHPFHTSTAEMEYNPRARRFEVSLKIHALDIEQALSARANRTVNIETDAQARPLLNEYLQSHFFLVEKNSLRRVDSDAPGSIDPKATRSKLHFIGQELEKTWLWLYFEIELPMAEASGEATPLILVNELLLDLTEGQINTVSVRRASKKSSLRMTAKQPWADMPFATPLAPR